MRSLHYREKLIIGIATITVVFTTGLGSTLFMLANTSDQIDKIVTQTSPTTYRAIDASLDLKTANKALHEFVLTGRQVAFERFDQKLKNFKYQLRILENNLVATDPKSNMQLDKLEHNINLIIKYSQELYKVRNNYLENNPWFAMATTNLNPPALEYLGYNNELIEEISHEINNPKLQIEALLYATDARHSWSQMMSYFRLALATRLKRDLANVYMYAEKNLDQLTQLNNLSLDLGYTFDGIPHLLLLRERFLSKLETVVLMFNDHYWKTDAEIMVNNIMPLFSSAERILIGLSKAQLNIKKETEQQLVNNLDTTWAAAFVVLIVGIITVPLIILLLIRNITTPVSAIKSVSERIIDGDLGARASIPAKDEFGILAESFNQITNELQKAVDQKEKLKNSSRLANKAKTKFLVQISHELRTPLNAILGYAQLLDTGSSSNLNEEQCQHLDHILTSGWHLFGLIDEILDITNIENGNIVVRREAIYVNDLIKDCIKTTMHAAQERNISVHFNENNKAVIDFNPKVSADPVRLRPAILKLLSNAISYNKPNGHIYIETNPVDSDKIKVTIRDTGYGLTSDETKVIFDPFQRLSSSNNIDGIGMGLTVSKTFIEAMDGRIGVESEVGAGTTFWIELPQIYGINIPLSGTNLIKLPSINQPMTGKIVYIEDNQSNQDLVKNIISKKLPSVELFCNVNAESGLKQIKEVLPDLILLDIELPDVNGIELLKELKILSQTRNIPVIAISANALSSNVGEGIRAGFNDYLTKPLDLTYFINTICRFLHPARNVFQPDLDAK